MKILTVIGTRPEIIRLSRIIPLLDRYSDHVLIHTGQNYNPLLKDVFFNELNIRNPNYFLECKSSSPGEQIGKILSGCESLFQQENPDRILILGDTNSGLCAIIAKRMGIPVFHMEAGNRCFDDRVPEEVNRRVIDHSSDILLPYTERSRMNLINEGIEHKRIFVTGNPILEVINYYSSYINKSAIIQKLNIKKFQYFLVTLHRAENVDNPERLTILMKSINLLQKKYSFPVIVSTHPHTKDRLNKISILDNPSILFLDPFGFFDFMHLEKNAFCVISDSGTVQEECSIQNIPNITVRETTERPETLEVGSNILSGFEPESIIRCADLVLSHPIECSIPKEYLEVNVSSIAAKIVLGYHK